MVDRQIDGLSLSAEGTSRVPSVGNDVVSWSDEDHIGGASGRLRNGLAFGDAPAGVEFLGGFLRDNHLIHELEGLIKGIDIVLLLVVF